MAGGATSGTQKGISISKKVCIFLERLEMVRAHPKSRQLHIGPFSNQRIAVYGDAANGRGAPKIRTLLLVDVTCDTKLG